MDTNAVSDYLSNSYTSAGMQWMDGAMNAIPNISVITQIELLCWETNADTEQKVKEFITDSIVCDIANDVITQCVTLRKEKRIKTPDAIIAATALSLKYTLITNNKKDFTNIKGLKIVNPHSLK